MVVSRKQNRILAAYMVGLDPLSPPQGTSAAAGAAVARGRELSDRSLSEDAHGWGGSAATFYWVAIKDVNLNYHNNRDIVNNRVSGLW